VELVHGGSVGSDEPKVRRKRDWQEARPRRCDERIRDQRRKSSGR
jgi:hypothetical protein